MAIESKTAGKIKTQITRFSKVVAKGYGKSPLMLLTNVEGKEDDLSSILEIYLAC